MIDNLKQYLKENINKTCYTSDTLHETIKALIFCYAFNINDIHCLPEVSKYVNSKKHRIDCVIVRRFTLRPLLAIEIDRSFKKRNYETLNLWDCEKLWIGYSATSRIHCDDKNINVWNIFDHLEQNHVQKKLLRSL